MKTHATFQGIITRHALRGIKDQAPGAGQKIVSCKVMGGGKPLTDDQLAKINRFAVKPLTADEVYHGSILLCHNGIDRDRERFNEPLLADYAGPGKSSIVGKGFFVAGHPGGWSGSGAPGEGKYFDAAVEQMTPERFKEITNEEIDLPEGVSMVHALMTHFYMLKLASNEDTRKNIDAGIYSFASIGFVAPYFAITDERGNHMYGEYRPKGEALEGSLVWLGAQPGAGVTKGAGGPRDEEKGAVAYGPTTMADEAREWDAAAAKKRLAKWASSDGSGDKEKMDWPKYRKGFAWYDPDTAEDFGGYKLPHHDVIDGVLSVVWKGCAAAMAACMGGRGGVDIPEAELPSVKSHLEKHYKQFDKEPPKEADASHPKGAMEPMEKQLVILGTKLGRAFTVEKLAEDVLGIIGQKDAEITRLTTENTGLKAAAVDGAAYRKRLIDDHIKAGVLLGEVKSDETSQKDEADFLATVPIARLEAMSGKSVAQAKKQFPDKYEIPAGDQKTREDQNAAAGGPAAPGGKSALVADAEKRAAEAAKK